MVLPWVMCGIECTSLLSTRFRRSRLEDFCEMSCEKMLQWFSPSACASAISKVPEPDAGS